MERMAFDATKPPRPKKGVDRETDMLGNRFGLVHSPIIREIKSSCNLEIDLDQPAEKVASPGTAGVASDGQEVGSLSAPRSRPRTSRD